MVHATHNLELFSIKDSESTRGIPQGEFQNKAYPSELSIFINGQNIAHGKNVTTLLRKFNICIVANINNTYNVQTISYNKFQTA